MKDHTCQPAVDLAVRRLGERDRATLERANALTVAWDNKAARLKTSRREEATIYYECARALTEALAGPSRGRAAS